MGWLEGCGWGAIGKLREAVTWRKERVLDREREYEWHFQYGNSAQNFPYTLSREPTLPWLFLVRSIPCCDSFLFWKQLLILSCFFFPLTLNESCLSLHVNTRRKFTEQLPPLLWPLSGTDLGTSAYSIVLFMVAFYFCNIQAAHLTFHLLFLDAKLICYYITCICLSLDTFPFIVFLNSFLVCLLNLPQMLPP